MNHDIFISYSSKQKSIADGVCHYLEENGFKCWMAPRDIPVGSEYGDLIEEAIKACKAVVLVFSEAASISKWVKGEINVAFTEDKPILPFRVDETAVKGGFRVMLNQMHWIDAYPQYADRLPDLLKSITGLLGRPEENSLNNGHEFVDLGLPSGTLWATCNVGSNKPEDYGDYYYWDEGNKVAAQRGNGWSMPTKEQWEELMEETKSTRMTRNGIKGSLFTAKNGNSLFLPDAGFLDDGRLYRDGVLGNYWSSSLDVNCSDRAWGCCFASDYSVYSIACGCGLSVRPVRFLRQN